MTGHHEKIEEYQHRADRDRGVGDVERPEMPAAKVHVDEIDHEALAQPIDQVAERSAENQRQPDAREALLVPEMPRVEADADERERRQRRSWPRP